MTGAAVVSTDVTPRVIPRIRFAKVALIAMTHRLLSAWSAAAALLVQGAPGATSLPATADRPHDSSRIEEVSAPAPATAPGTRPAFEVGRFDPNGPVKESSALAASRRHPGVFWTHGDSGNPPTLFAVTREGKLLGAFPVAAKNDDWEDVALDDEGHLFIGEIGNNGGKKKELAIYEVDEPDPFAPKQGAAPPAPLRVKQTWRLRFPEQPFDCESLFVRGNYGYVVAKLFPGLRPGLYRFPLTPQNGQPATLQRVQTLPLRSPVTSADLSADGKRLALMTITGPYLLDVEGDFANGGPITVVGTPSHVQHIDLNEEGICFVKEGLLGSTEGGQILLFRFEDFRKE